MYGCRAFSTGVLHSGAVDGYAESGHPSEFRPNQFTQEKNLSPYGLRKKQTTTSPSNTDARQLEELPVAVQNSWVFLASRVCVTAKPDRNPTPAP